MKPEPQIETHTIHAEGKIKFQHYQDEAKVQSVINDMMEAIVKELATSKMFTLDEKRDNVNEEVTCRASLTVVDPKDAHKARRVQAPSWSQPTPPTQPTREQLKAARDEAFKSADRGAVKLLADQVEAVVKAQAVEIMQTMLDELDALRPQILEATTGRFVMDMIWFRLNAKKEALT